MNELRRLPNALSLCRVLLAILFIPAGQVVRIVLVCLAGATDFLDGWIARQTNTATRWGALLDPIADRLFVVVAIGTYVLNGELSIIEALLLLPRDMATALAFAVARFVPSLRMVEFRARFPGKIVTVLQLVVLILLVTGVRRLTPLIGLVAVVSLFAIVDYAHALWQARAR